MNVAASATEPSRCSDSRSTSTLEENVTLPSSQPTATPMTTPSAILYATSYANQRAIHDPTSVPSSASRIAP